MAALVSEGTTFDEFVSYITSGEHADSAAARVTVEAFGGPAHCATRFLGLHGSAKKAKKKFDATAAWRKECAVDRINETAAETVERIHPSWSGRWIGWNPDGSPVQIWRVGAMRPKQFTSDFSENEITQFYIHYMEQGLSMQRARGMTQTIEIYDLAGVKSSQVHIGPLNLLSRVLSIGQKHYPENLRKAYVINAPGFFQAGFACVEPVLGSATRSKLRVSQGDLRSELEVLLGNELTRMLDPSSEPSLSQDPSQTGNGGRSGEAADQDQAAEDLEDERPPVTAPSPSMMTT